ncbi:MAG: ABC transporter permease [Gammaproteobacteria bacterium]|nr:ABC transporter permease [Gammaproteobacteria bacterium]
MRAIRLAFRALRRDWRAGELSLLGAAVIVAVGALTTAATFTDRVGRAMELQATELLAADLVLESPEPPAPEVLNAATEAGLTATTTSGFRSMAVAAGRLELSEVKAVDQDYPLRGSLRTADDLFGEEIETRDVPAPGTVWPDARLMQALALRIGDRISLGSAELVVQRILAYEPDRGGDLFNIAPRLLMNLADVPRTGLILPGSRVQYRLLLRGPADDIDRFRGGIESREGLPLRIYGIRDARPELKTALERARQFLGLAVLVSVALCGLAIAMSARRFAHRHYDSCAILRCLGASQSLIGRVFLYELGMVAVLFSAAGCTLGLLCQEGLAVLLRGLTVRALPAPTLLPMASGTIAGIAAVLGFALPWLWQLSTVPPLRVLRRDLAPMPPRAVTVYGAALLILALLTPWQAGEFRLTAYVTAGLAGTAAVLALCAWAAIRLVDRLRSRVGISWRFGIANVARRARDSMAQILGIGLGATAMLLLTLARTDLLDAWENRIDPGTPNYFLINIQPDQAGTLKDFMARHATVTADFYPMVRGRLTHINDREVLADRYTEPRAQRLATREFNLSWAERLQRDNTLVSGQWWPRTGTPANYFSVEDGIAQTLGLSQGDKLTYRIAGQEVTGRILNIRRVEWDSFNVNFFVVASPGTLETYPATYITSFHLPASRRALLGGLVRAFPSVTVIDVAAVLSQVRAVMEQVSRTVEFVFVFTLAAGLIVLMSAIQTTHDERCRESAILRSLGATRRRVLAALTAEFAVLGAITGGVAAVAATVIELVLAEFVFRIEVSVNPWIWLAGPTACLALILAGGYIGTRRALAVAPIDVLQRA